MVNLINQNRRNDNRHNNSVNTYKQKRHWISSKLRYRDGPKLKERTKRNQIQQLQQQHEQTKNFVKNLQPSNSWMPMTYTRPNRRKNNRISQSKILQKKLTELYILAVNKLLFSVTLKVPYFYGY